MMFPYDLIPRRIDGVNHFRGWNLKGCSAKILGMSFFQNFLMKQMLKRQMKGVPEEEQEKIFSMIEKNPEFFTQIAEEILSGKKGPHRDIVVLTAACALYATDIVKNIKEGIERATEAIDSGKAMEKLKTLRAFSRAEVVSP